MLPFIVAIMGTEATAMRRQIEEEVRAQILANEWQQAMRDPQSVLEKVGFYGERSTWP